MELTAKQQAVEAVKKAESILILSSVHPDGDSLGACLALLLFLEKLGKKVLVACSDPVPEYLRFLPRNGEIVSEIQSGRDFVISLDISSVSAKEVKYHLEGKKLNLIITPAFGKFSEKDVSFAQGGFHFDLVIVADAADTELLGPVYEENVDLFYETPVLSIDHHASNEYFGEINLVDITASSTCEIVVSLLEALDLKFLDEDIATCLLTGIITDTGSFQHSNTTPKSLTIAAQLVAAGGRQQEIVKAVFKTKKLSTLRLWGEILARLVVVPELRLAWSSVSQDDYAKSEALEGESSGVIDELLSSVPQAEVVVLLSEKADSSVCGSIRTAKGVDAIAIASLFGGGGHAQAAGFKVEQTTLAQSEGMIIDAIKKWQNERLSPDLLSESFDSQSRRPEAPSSLLPDSPRPPSQAEGVAGVAEAPELTKVSDVLEEKVEGGKYSVWTEKEKITTEKSSPAEIIDEVLRELKGGGEK